VSRLRTAPRAPLAVAGILAMPLFFLGLMAMSLAIEKPSVHHVLKHGVLATKLADPSGTNEGTIWLLAFLIALGLVVVGAGAMLAGRAGVVVSALAATGAALALVAPLATWERHHAARFPDGVDLIPRSAGSEDIYLRGEWEGNARHTADQLASATIAIAGAAVVVLLLLEVRRRRGPLRPPAPLPPEIASGEAQLTRGRAGEPRF
jgi:hypothetical protein